MSPKEIESVCVDLSSPPAHLLSEWRAAGILFELCHNIVTLTVDRPQARNALHIEAMKRLSDIITWCHHSKNIQALILTGAHGHFISGGDLRALSTLREEADAEEMSQRMQHTLESLSTLPYPVISAIEGFAIGGGAEVALSTDLRIFSEEAYILFPHRSLGLSTAWGGARRLAEIVGSQRAFSILATHQKISSAEALTLGLAHRVCPSGQTLAVALKWAKQLAETPDATRGLKVLTQRESMRDVKYLERERSIFASLWASASHWERVDAFWTKNQKSQQTKNQKRQRGAERDTGVQKRGRFIVLEGIDGAGTTTQGERLVEWITESGHSAHFTREPSDGQLGVLIRRALAGEGLGHNQRALPSESIALLFSADRADHWHNEIEPLLKSGVHVICDRYLYSSIAYQGLEHPEDWIRTLNAPYPLPDLLLYIQVDPECAAQRRVSRGKTPDRYEIDTLQQQISARYDRVCLEAGACIIDGARSIEEVSQDCCAEVYPFIFPSVNSTDRS